MTTKELRRDPRARVSHWTSRIIVGESVGLEAPPAWLETSHAIFSRHVLHDEFPCFFGTRAERRGEMFYAFSPHSDWQGVAQSVRTFCELSARKEYQRANLALFFEPHATPLDLTQSRAFCWRLLQHLHDTEIAQNGVDGSKSEVSKLDVNDPAWEFTAFDTEMFVVGCSPAYVKRKSRNLGPGIVMLFQPRRVFVDLVTKKAISSEARAEVRRRLVAWDDLPHHPDLGVYGDPNNREWKQYFLDDDNEPAQGGCPFIQRWRRSEIHALPSVHTTLAAVLSERARTTPDATAVTFLARTDAEPTRYSYRELERAARSLATKLLARAEPGDRALLLLPSGPEFVVAFFACLYARLIAVPAYPVPSAKQNAEQRTRLVGMLRDAEPRLLLIEPDASASLQHLAPEIAPQLLSERAFGVRLDTLAATDAVLPEPAPSDVAFLQYTSGSTSAPKGVMVTHANLMANEAAIARAFAFRADDVVVSWLPLYHDMGLIGSMLAPIYNGVPLVLMSPQQFLQAPVRWLRAMSEHGGTVSGGPDFAFRLALQRVRDEELRDLDLSRWRVAFCGAEPIRAATLHGFAQRFAAQGFDANALLPCYGLAEATLIVSSTDAGTGMRDASLRADALARGVAEPIVDASQSQPIAVLVDCGSAVAGHVVRICDPETGLECEEGVVGELWVSGPSIAAGYWQDAVATARSFPTVALADGSSERCLRTGDLGFMRHGRVFVSGRVKDLIILRGQNVYPQDVERALEEQVPQLREGRVAAFSVATAEGEAIGVAAELSAATLARLRSDTDARAQLLAAVQQAVAGSFQTAPELVLLLKPGTLPRTSSGKLRRSACLRDWRAGTLAPFYVHERRNAPVALPHVPPRTLVEHALASLWNELLGPAVRSVHADFFAEGGESITAARLSARIDAMFGLPAKPAELFEARSIAEQARLIEAHSAGPRAHTPERIATLAGERRPLSAAQRGLWFQHKLDPASAAYTIVARLRATGALDAAALKAALSLVVERHELLRARFREEAGEVTWTPAPVAEAYAWRELPVAEEAAARAFVEQPFDLVNGPLVRVALVQTSPLEHELTLALPHLIADGASAEIVWRELAHGYAVQRGQALPPLAALPIQYGDYAAWEARPERAEAEARALEYWRERLGGELAPTAAPGKRSAPLDASAHPDAADRVEVLLPSALVEALRELGRRSSATLPMTLLAAFDVLLYRYAGERAITLGVPTSTRTRVELEALIGHFVQLSVHHLRVQPAWSFADVLAEVRKLSIAAAKHALPFERLASALRSGAPGSAVPELPIAFNHQLLSEEARLDGVVLSSRELGNAAASFDWSLDVRESRAGTRCVLEFRRVWFEREFMQQVLADYVALLTQVTTDPDRKLFQVALTAGETQLAELSPFEPMLDRFARLAREQPDADAVSCEGETLSYAELARWSQAISQRLVAHDASAETRVGVCLERSVAIAPALLGVLGAGSAFVPLDPAYPAARLTQMLEDAQIALVLVDEVGRRALQAHASRLTLLDAAPRAPQLERPWPARVWPEQLAYTIFTSGSTGRAKGVDVSQRALALHVDDCVRRYALTAADTALQFSTISFDAALEQLLPVLSVGGRALLRGPQTWDWHELAAVFRHGRVTLADFPTNYWQAFTHALRDVVGPPESLRLLTVGGEALRGDAVARHRDSPWGHVRLDNTYGPTEAAISVCGYTTSERDLAQAAVALGRAFAGRRIYVLDADGQRVPRGASGELCIGGESVARGYAARPGLTAERFVPDPFAGAACGDRATRLYRTGDRCRQRADGSFEYLGRLDEQVKLRGYRIELAEIERALRACAGVRDAVASVRAHGERQELVAYVTGEGSVDAWRAALVAQLPAYMLPSAIVLLDALPRLPNGKLDRRALPEPMWSQEPAREPETALERAFVEIFREVLGREQVQVGDDFFALGGDSIASLQVVARARALGLSITPRSVFEFPTSAGLAAFAQAQPRLAAETASQMQDADDAHRHEAWLARHGLQSEQIAAVYPATPIQAGLLFHAGLGSAEGQGYYVDQLSLSLRGPLSAAALERAWQAAVERHPILRTAFVVSGEGTWQVVQRTAALPFIVHDASDLGDAAYVALLERVRESEASQGFDVSKAPLLRLALLRRPDGEHDLIWTNHHAILDGWSTGQLASEVLADHAALARGEEPERRPGPDYAQYVHWLRAQPSAERYWQGELSRWSEPATLADAFGAPAASDAGRSGSRHLPQRLAAELCAQLKLAAARARVTLPTLVQAAFGCVLAHVADRSQAVFGSTFSDRPPQLADSQRMLGLFIHSVPVCVRVQPELEVDAFLRAVQQQHAELRAHGHAALSDLQRWAGTPGQSLFDSVLVFENYPLPEAVAAAADGTRLEVSARPTRDRTHYPLTLTVYPRTGSADAQVDLEWEWDVARVDAAWVQLVSQQLLATLTQFAASGSRRVGELTWNHAPEPSLSAAHGYRALPTRVAAAARATPAQIALWCEGEQATYAELEARANAVALALRAAGAGPETLVGVSLSRSLALPAALLGVWRAGGAYVPLDPAYPAARLRELLAGVAVIVCDQHARDAQPELLASRPLVHIDQLPAAPAHVEGWPEPHPEQLAYVIYTSGSTGKPKGVAVSHGALSAHVDDFLQTYALGSRDRVLFSSTINFDVSLHELFPALTVGGRVVMRGEAAWSLETLSAVLREQRVSFARIATAYWQAWSKALRDETFPDLSQVTVGGEGLAGDALAHWFAGPLARVALDNLYGPTETTVAALRHRTRAHDASARIVSIGRAFASRTARVTGQAGQAAVSGARGELCIGGSTLARGYLGAPGLTAERFVPDPARPGQRVYRSGDVCRERADGSIEFLGRRDAQVKLRGHRIELSDVESALRSYPGVEAAVAEIKGQGEQRRLVGYVTGAGVELRELPAWLAARLPAYMVPAACVHLPALPVLPNGKLDRRALPEPALAAREAIAPRDAIEQLLWTAWRAVLKRDDLSVDDNFFELGGDSISSLQIVARAREAGVEITPQQLFERPTIAALARVATRASAVVPQLASASGPVPLTPIQARFFEEHPGGTAHWNQSLLLKVERGERPFDVRALERVLASFIERHDALRLRFERDADTQRWRAEVAPAELALQQAELRVIDLRAEADAQAALAREGLAVQQSLDLQRGPLLRAAYFSLPDGEARLLLAVHHLAVDGVSWRVLLDELERGYARAEAGAALDWPRPSTPFCVWARRSHDYAQRADFSAELAYWRTSLAAAEPRWPAQRDQPSTYGTSRELVLRWSKADTQRLLAMAPRAYRLRVDEVLLTALAQTLAEHAGQPELLVELEGHGREDVLNDLDLSRSVGWFTTQFPVCLRAATADAASALIAVKEQLRRVPGRGFAWGYIRESARELPQPRVSFNYLGSFELQGPARDAAPARFSLAQEFAGDAVDRAAPLAHPLDINAIVQEGALELSFRYAPECIDAELIERVVARYDAALRALVDHGLAATPLATASDFPAAQLTQAELVRSRLDLTTLADLYPATAMQAGLIYHSESAAAEGVYLYQLQLRLSGELDVAAFRDAWRDVVQRHDVLRTSFVWLDREDRERGGRMPWQAVQRAVDVPFAFHDWSHEPGGPGDYAARLAAYCADDRARGFDTGSAPLLRLHVIRAAARRFDVVWTMHHALGDGWSSARILEEVLQAYVARKHGRTARAASLAPRYRDYIAWLAQRPSSEAFFRARLAEVDDPAFVRDTLPTLSTSRASEQGSARKAWLRPADWTERLKDAARRLQVTVATLAEAAWALVLARAADRPQVVFGVTVSGRPAELAGSEHMVGPFLNTLPVWTEVARGSGDQRATAWLARLQAAAAARKAHEHVPLTQIQRWASAGPEGLFDSVLVVENYPLDRARLEQLAADGGLSVQDVQTENRTHYALTWTLTLEPQLELAGEWDRAQLPSAWAERLASELLGALERLSELRADEPRSVRDLLQPPAPGPVPQPACVRSYRSVLARIGACANVRPMAPAVTCDGQTLSYAALHAWSNQVAAQLAGVARDERVGLGVQRSVALVAALLGIWKAGGAYVPLDPSYPAERLRGIARSVGLTRIVADAHTRAQLAELLPDCEVIVLEPCVDADAFDDELDVLPEEPHPEQLAYVLSTSGSTGEPKNVAISQRALAVHVDDYIERNQVSARDRVYQFSTFNFDMACDQLFPALSVGASVVMRGPEVPGWTELHAALAEHSVTLCELPTAYAQAFVASRPAALPALRTLLVGGEELTPAFVAEFRRSALAPASLRNVYGPTETAILVTIHEANEADARASRVPLGTTLPARALYVLDRFGREVGPGALGELCIAGPTLARGYDGRSRLTAERFVPDPYGPAGARMYRTGDLCRRTPDGLYLFEGRRDDQIKLRGYRIELGEIENALRACPGVTQALALVRPAREGRPAQLVAYVTGAVDASALVRELATKLPSYLVPQAIAVLAEIPLKQNGKVDRAALPDPTADAQLAEDAPARTPTEASLLALFREVLGRDDVGIHSDFLALGGDSIVSLRVVARAREQGLYFTPRQVLEHSTIAALAAVVSTQAGAERRESLRALPLTPIQAQFFAAHPQGESHFNQGVLLATHELLDVAALETALARLVARHDALRLQFQWGDGAEVTQRVTRTPAPLRLQLHDLRASEHWQAQLASLGDALQTSLHLSAGPLMAAAYFRVPSANPNEGRLLVVAHHLSVDGVSWRILLDELIGMYDAALRGEPAPALTAPLPWSAWVEALLEYAASSDVQAELPAWLELASRVPPQPNAPLGTDAESTELALMFDAAWTEQLLAEAPRAYRLQLDDVLLTALARALQGVRPGAQWIDVENHGRESIAQDVDPSRSVGWFTSLVPVLLEPESSAEAALLQTKRALRRAPLRGLHHGLLAQLGSDETRAALARVPRPLIGFNYLGRFELRSDARERFSPASEACGRFVADASRLMHALEVNASIRAGALSVKLRCDRRWLAPADHAELVQAFERELRALAGLLAAATPRLSAADFPLARLEPAAFERLQLSAHEVEDVYPATPLQQGLLFHTLLERESAATNDRYVNQVCVSVRGELDVPRMRAAWQTVIARHAILRTHFVWAHGGEMLQVVSRHAQLPWREIDAGAHSDYPAFRDAWLREDLAQGIVLERAPLLRVTLLRHARGCDLVLTNHHALLDGWSGTWLLREVRDAYAAPRAVRAPAPAFREYVAWLAQQPSAEDFWRGKLATGEGALLLDALEAPRGLLPAHDDARFEQALPEALCERLRARAQAERVTFGTLLHAAWALVSSRYADRAHVVFGTTVSGRPASLPSATQMLGLFIHSLPLGVQVADEAALGAFLHAVQRDMLQLQQHAHTPLHELQGWAGRPGAPLFDSLLIFENFPAADAPSGELAFELISGYDRTHYPLTLTLTAQAAVSVIWTWQSERISRELVTALAEQLAHVLEQLAEPRVQRLGDVQLLTPDVARLSAADGGYAFVPVFERIRAQAARTPDAIAVACGAERTSYRELIAHATTVAAQLRAALAGDALAEPRIGLCVERSQLLPVALLGILAAGGAYVPLDPTYPEERLRFMLDDAQLTCVVADRASAERHARLFETRRVVCIEPGAPIAAAAGWTTPPVHPEQLAYVLYTSGSTGRPKGVGVRHEALDRFLASYRSEQPATPQLSAADVWVSVTSPSFDISALELLLPLTLGAQVVVATQAEVTQPARLAALLEHSRASVLQATPTLWRELAGERFELERPLLALCGGEALPQDLAEQLLARGCVLWNQYGPTETTIWSAGARIASAERIVLGVPLPGTSLRVVDRAGRDVPAGAVGELCIGGTNLARGYWGRPGATAERFVPDADGARLYRTGDLCRLTQTGELVFVGRSDAQLKLRGHRIELEEIEIALRSAPGVRDAAVVAAGSGSQLRLVGYVAGDDALELDMDGLRAWLAQRLPSIMVPSALHRLASLPRTLNGKLARAQLAAQEPADRAPEAPPSTETERALASIWSELLGQTAIGRDADFFALGGHSLSAVRLSTRVAQQLGRKLALGTILATPTLRAQAEALERAALHEPSAPAELPRTAASGPVPLTSAQERLWFLWKLEPSSAAYHITGALRLEGPLDRAALQRALHAVVARHESLRTYFVEHTAGVEARLRSADELRESVWRALDVSADTRAELDARLAEHAAQPFDLARGPLLRVTLFERAADEHVLLVSLHHSIADGASVDLFLGELAALYAAYAGAAEREPELPALPRQFSDYARWERAPEHAALRGSQLAYWRERLAGELEALELPADRVRRSERKALGSHVVLGLPAQSVNAVRALALHTGTTRFSVLLAGLSVLLSRYSGARAPRVGIPVSTRRHAETEPLIGMFVNTLVHRAELAPTLSVAELVRATSRRLAADFEQRDVPFAELVSALAPERSRVETPLFNVSFNFEEGARAALALPGVRASAWPLQQTALAYDLMFDVAATETAIEVSLGYVHDRFSAEAAQRVLSDYAALLGELFEQRASQLGALALCTPALPARPRANHAFRSVYARFVEQATSRPNAPALAFEGASFSYAELHDWSRAIAARLRAHGVQPRDRVAVCLERSPAVVAAILAVLETGAAYVPLDPRYPDERLSYTARDAAVSCVIAAQPLAFVAALGLHVISPELGEPPRAQAHELAHAPHPEELAYLIYTSGSTGDAKGVAVTQRNLARLFDAAESMRSDDGRALAFGPDDTWTLFHSPAFDFSVWEIFGPLTSGGRLVVVPYATTRDPEAFARLLADERITVLNQTPSAFLPLMRVDCAAAQPLEQLRVLIFGGERLEPASLLPWVERRGASLPAIINMYGITETTVHVTERVLTRELRETRGELPSVIGGPLDDLSLYVLDADLNEVPVLGSGELYVGGAGLARGYWRRPGLTASRFIPDPFDVSGQGARLYASGDRARRLPNGDIEYLGRSDFQVKIRGFRIELGEIEAALRQHPAVRDAVVLARTDESPGGYAELLAFVVAPELAGEPSLVLRAHLAARVPAHMLPNAFELLPQLPLTANGKLDRAALLARTAQPRAALGHVEPETAIEQLICRVFAEVLGVPRVFADADFFALGGHSLLAVRASAALSAAFGREIAVAALFDHPSVRTLAEHVTAQQRADSSAALMSDLLDELMTDA